MRKARGAPILTNTDIGNAVERLNEEHSVRNADIVNVVDQKYPARIEPQFPLSSKRPKSLPRNVDRVVGLNSQIEWRALPCTVSAALTLCSSAPPTNRVATRGCPTTADGQGSLGKEVKELL